MATGEDPVMECLRSFCLLSLSPVGAPMEPEKWRDLVKDNEATFQRFQSSEEFCQLFLFQREDSSLAVSLDFPPGISSKVICASKSIPGDGSRTPLDILEIPGGKILEYICNRTEQVICPLLSNPNAKGLASEALSIMEELKKETQVIKAQVEGQIVLPPPAFLSDHSQHDDSQLDDHGEHGQLDFKILHACEGTIIEWVEIVSEFLQQDGTKLVLEGPKPCPSDEFVFWNKRLKTLSIIQQQLMSHKAQQLASIVQMADSFYWPVLQGLYKDVLKGLQEAEAETANLTSLNEIEEAMQQLDYQQLKENLAPVMKKVGLLWDRSQLHHQPERTVVLLQEICNLIINLSRKFLQGEELLCGLMLEPEVVLKKVPMVMETLQTLKGVYADQCSLQQQQQQRQDSLCWDFPKHMIFSHVDQLLARLHSIQEVLFVREQMYQLDEAVLSGVQGGMWTDVLHQVFVDFVAHLKKLSDCGCDPTDTEDQNLKVHLDQFHTQVLDLDLQLVSILSQNLQNCQESTSAAKLLKMFGCLLDRPVIRQHLHPQLSQVVRMVLQELEETKQLFNSQKDQPQILGKFCPAAVAKLSWTQQLCGRAEETMRNFRTVQHLCVASDEPQLVLQRFQQMMKLLEEHREELRSVWSSELEAGCDFLFKQPLILHSQQGELEVSYSYQLEELLRELRYASRERNMELCPNSKRLSTCRDDVFQSLRSLNLTVSRYNQVLRGLLPVEHPLVQDRFEALSQTLSQLQRDTWSSTDVHQHVKQFSQLVLLLHCTWKEARAALDELTVHLQGWAELQLLQRSSDSLLEEGMTEQSLRIQREGEELLRLTQVIRGVYKADSSSEVWISYLDYIHDQVQDSLFTMLSRALNYLSDCTHPQRCSGALLGVSLILQESDGVFKSTLDSSLLERLQSIISDLYTASSLPPKVSVSRDGNYQEFLRQNAELSSLEQEVLHHVEDVSVEVENLRSGLDRFSNLWQSDKIKMFQEFLTYSRQLGADEVEPQPISPTLKDFQRELESLRSLSSELSLMEEVQLLQGWLQVDLGPFRDSLLSIIYSWKDMYTTFLLQSVTASLLQVTRPTAQDEESSSSSSFPLTQTILLLESFGVQLPQHLAAQLQS